MKPMAVVPQLDLSAVKQIVTEHGTTPDQLIPILHAIQAHYRYLPNEALEYVCKLTDITPAAITGVSTFYAHFRHKPVGKHIIGVCHGTACHVKGADRLEETLRRHLAMSDNQQTSNDGLFTIERLGCVGCCTLAPVLQMDDVTVGHLTTQAVPETVADFLGSRQAPPERAAEIIACATSRGADAIEFQIGCGSCCLAGGAGEVRQLLEQAVDRAGGSAIVRSVGCTGMCHRTPMVEVNVGGKPVAFYDRVQGASAKEIVRRHVRPRALWRRLRQTAADAVESVFPPLAEDEPPNVEVQKHSRDIRDPAVCEFLGPQKRISTEFGGMLEPLNLAGYITHGGFEAAKTALAQNKPLEIIETIKTSGLRGRGGAGFPTGVKWARTRASVGDRKYIICNGDEGDPGAFMDRMILESFPYRVIEGMIIASLAVGASEGIFYIRHEYPLAVERIRQAIPKCESYGFLGDNILGSGHSLKLRVVEGAGAFVCGKETALIASIEGGRGMPRLRPPYPAESGLWGKPTCINNVETYALVPWIISHGAKEFAAIGTATSKGTKVFALTGKIARGGLIEVPMGVTLRQIVEEIGGGIANGRKFKAVQIGGPSGGCIPASLADLPVDYESLSGAGSIMGSGGLVVLDDSDCMVDIARYFLKFTQAESCGKCTFCRVGTKVMLDILEKLCAGKAKASDLAKLEELCTTVKAASLCGLGQTAPNPVLSTLRHFRDEYEAHVRGQCPAHRCKALVKYAVNDKCIGCTKCAQGCPVDAIPMTPYEKHSIDVAKCTRCDVCRTVCPENAIEVTDS
jgi:NADH-quinone oxidoreductase subunit F